MRVHDKPLAPDETEIWYVRDLPDGEVLVSCGHCETETTDVKKPTCQMNETCECSRCQTCGKFPVYRPWWEW